MYGDDMKTITITIPDELDAEAVLKGAEGTPEAVIDNQAVIEAYFGAD